ncbi:condensation domain-containing protein [Marinomonas transparens]|uniref:Condensation protein n=1 Tax=Marinomonas transparens TaxID=2795388 RepID=A0A934N1B5_9GAMM|nr:condensation domain-containing protein [Marinomonas transparens]MBJ7539350.1 condensation protein [Marinomonas transparens]
MLTQASISNVTPSLPVSEYEENIWMLQLQQPEQVSRNISAWELSNDANLPLLSKVIHNLIEEIPDLNVRYNFSDDGDLMKYKAEKYEACLNLLTLEADEVSNYLSKLKDIPWDAAVNPPFNSFIIQTEYGVTLALDLHPILDQSYQLEDLITLIQNNYYQLSKDGQVLNLTEIDQSPVGLVSGIQQPNESTQLRLTKSQIANIILDEFRTALVEPDMALEDDFFDYGGHSLLATRIIGNLMQSHGIEVSFNDFFKSPSAMVLADYATANGQDNQQDASEFLLPEGSAPLTFAQDFLWQAYSAYEFSPIYNLPFAIKFFDKVDETILLKAFTDVLVRHAGLRTRFQSSNGVTSQCIIPVSELNQYKWFWDSSESEGVTLSDEASYQFDLTCELPLRIRFIHNLPDEPQVLSLLIHHMVIDEWSLNTIMADLSHAYMARASHSVPSWNLPARNINDFAFLQEKQGLNRQHVDYWINMLRGATRGLALSDSGNQSDASNEISTKAQWMELDLGNDAFKKLSAFARLHGSSIFSVLYTAITLSLHKQGNLDEIVIGTSASGRTEADFFDTVGYFTTMVAHRVQFDTDDSVDSLLQDITYKINESMQYADIPINLIQKELGMAADDGLLFDVYIHIHSNNALNGELQTSEGSIHYQQIPPEKNDSMFGLHFEIMDNVSADGQHALRLVTTYQQERYSQGQVESIFAKINTVLAMFDTEGDCKKPLKQIQL